MTDTIFSPVHPPDPDTFLSRTASINFASAVIAADLLEFVRVEVNPNGREVQYVLADPFKLAPELQNKFNRGVFRNVNPKILFDVRGYLSDESNKARGVTRGSK
jgi:hypothetical protein